MNPNQLQSAVAAGPFKSGGGNADVLALGLTRPVSAPGIGPIHKTNTGANWQNRLTFQSFFSSLHLQARPQQ